MLEVINSLNAKDAILLTENKLVLTNSDKLNENQAFFSANMQKFLTESSELFYPEILYKTAVNKIQNMFDQESYTPQIMNQILNSFSLMHGLWHAPVHTNGDQHILPQEAWQLIFANLNYNDIDHSGRAPQLELTGDYDEEEDEEGY